ncbi:CARDB domain-containing protein [Halovivax gelatinilyticus]|uniref:CARDB domain-containing protein n=1 Tax=Halovivax gelatinilyticus TaxID=2961597 RepID=UPI0020CA87C0|nr:CARDB domain-containing protein [Halovivax gelatinilyticus]
MSDRRFSGTQHAGAILAVVIVLGLTVAVPGTVTADSSAVDLECTEGDGGGPVYLANSGLAVVDNDSAPDEAYPSFPDNETIHLDDDDYPNVTFSAGGDAELRLENRTTERICLAAVDATEYEILIDPANLSAVTVNGSVDGLAFGDLDFDVDDEPEVVYNASDAISLTIHDTGLEEGDSIAIESLDSDAVDAEVDADSNGSLLLDLPAGEHRLSLSTASSGGGLPGLPPPPPDEEPAAFEISDVEIDPASVDPGDSVTVSATVTNVGEETGGHAVELAVDGDVVAEESVHLAGGGSERVTFTVVLDEPGAKSLSLDGESIGSVAVADPDDSTGESDDDGGTEAPDSDDADEPLDPETDSEGDDGSSWFPIALAAGVLIAVGLGGAYHLGYLGGSDATRGGPAPSADRSAADDGPEDDRPDDTRDSDERTAESTDDRSPTEAVGETDGETGDPAETDGDVAGDDLDADDAVEPPDRSD